MAQVLSSMDEELYQLYFVESMALMCLFFWFKFFSSMVEGLQQPYFVESVDGVEENVASTTFT